MRRRQGWRTRRGPPHWGAARAAMKGTCRPASGAERPRPKLGLPRQATHQREHPIIAVCQRQHRNRQRYGAGGRAPPRCPDPGRPQLQRPQVRRQRSALPPFRDVPPQTQPPLIACRRRRGQPANVVVCTPPPLAATEGTRVHGIASLPVRSPLCPYNPFKKH